MNDSGAAILNFGDEFGPNAIGKAMKNDGPNLSANNLSANKVTPFDKRSDSLAKDELETMGGAPTPGYSGTKLYGGSDGTDDAN